MVGIGSAPNSFLMNRAAELGRGTFTHIASAEQVEERMRGLFEKLESPAVTNLSVTLSAGEADTTPAALPDLYRGEPLVLAAKIGATKGTIDVKGTIGDRPWSVSMPLANAADGNGLSKLWARRKIADAEVARTMRQISVEDADKRILALALEHHLVTRLTSLVAVDETPSRPPGAKLSRADLPLNLPAGWDFDKVFGERTRSIEPTREPGQPIEMRKVDHSRGVQLASYASAVAKKTAPVAGTRPSATPKPQGIALPKTATDAELRMLFGLLLCAMSLLLLVVRRRLRPSPA
jgi:Ca-activated chloride channel family protein